MSKTKKSESPLIFIDTNIFLDFYSIGNIVSNEYLEFIVKYQEYIIITNQIEMEFKKNRKNVLTRFIKNFEIPDFKSLELPPILEDKNFVDVIKECKTTMLNEYEKMKKNANNILHSPSKYDNVFQTLQKIFNNSSTLNIKNFPAKKEEIYEKAKKRFLLGYPPRKKGDNSFGDAFNWEWIKECCKNNPGRDVYIVSRDGDYGLIADKINQIDEWLLQEFHDEFSISCNIFLTNRLSTLFEKMKEPVSTEMKKNEMNNISKQFKINLENYRNSLLFPEIMKIIIDLENFRNNLFSPEIMKYRDLVIEEIKKGKKNKSD